MFWKFLKTIFKKKSCLWLLNSLKKICKNSRLWPWWPLKKIFIKSKFMAWMILKKIFQKSTFMARVLLRNSASIQNSTNFISTFRILFVRIYETIKLSQSNTLVMLSSNTSVKNISIIRICSLYSFKHTLVFSHLSISMMEYLLSL